MSEAEEMLRSFRGIVKAENVKPADQTKFFGQLDAVTGRRLLSKPMELKFKMLQDIAVHFMSEVGKLVGKDLRGPPSARTRRPRRKPSQTRNSLTPQGRLWVPSSSPSRTRGLWRGPRRQRGWQDCREED